VLAKDLAGTAHQPLGIDHVRGSRLVHPDLHLGELLDQPAGGAGVVEMNVREQDRLRNLVAKSVQQPVHGLFRTRINDYSVEEVGCDRPRLVEMEQVNGFRDIASHGAEITGRRTNNLSPWRPEEKRSWG
jgi:hypothetical protein